ncbi:MAG: type II secretion system F family protein [Clostridia bacterium]|nr:type II secretion system F family protein [Clostridia bacterium]
MTYPIQLALLGLSSILSGAAAIFLFRASAVPPVITGLPVFFLESLYPAGGRLRNLLRLRDRRSRERYRKLLEFLPPAEAEPVRDNAGDAGATYVMLLAPLLLQLLAVTGDLLLLLLEALLLGGLCFYFDYWLDSMIRKRHAEVRTQYPAMLTELSLMVNVGITAGEAFDRVAVSSGGLLFREMRLVSESVQNGMPVDEALDNLCVRAPLREVKKFVSLYKQNLVKGGPDFPRTLAELAENAWTERKNTARAAGELAEQKLLLPTLCMFVGILLMIIVPAFQNLF